MRAFAFAAVLFGVAWPRVVHAGPVDVCIAAAEHAQEHQKAGALRAARAELLVCAREGCPRAVRTDCLRWLGELDTAMPSLVLRVVDAAGVDVVQVRVIVDGATVAERLDGRPMELDPGAHVLRIERGTAVAEMPLLARSGERDRLVTVTLPPNDTKPPATDASIPKEPAPRTSAFRVPTGAWIVAGVGLAALSTGAVFWARGLSDRSDLYGSCGRTQSCSSADIDGSRTSVIIGDVAIGLGLVAIGAAIVWTWVTSTSTRPAR